MEVLGQLFEQLVQQFASLGVAAYFILFVIALLDSLIITGTFMNGTAFLLLAGLMVSKGTHDFAAMTLFASAGAICGGLMSYHLGLAGRIMLTNKSKKGAAKRHASQSELLIKRYGGFGVFVGRFLGPISSVVAFVAGVSKMSRSKFFLWNILAGLCWGVGYVTIGMVFGDSLATLQIL